MNKDLKVKWLADLRSGNYQQARSVLRNFDRELQQESFCCLGVLCKTAGAVWQEWNRSDEDIHEYFQSVPVLNGVRIGDQDDENLTKLWSHQIGITEEQRMQLVEMNDGFGLPGAEYYKAPKSFLEIADWIEANL